MESEASKGVNGQILEQFFKTLQDGGVSASIVERIRRAATSGEVSEAGLKRALFPDDTEI